MPDVAWQSSKTRRGRKLELTLLVVLLPAGAMGAIGASQPARLVQVWNAPIGRGTSEAYPIRIILKAAHPSPRDSLLGRLAAGSDRAGGTAGSTTHSAEPAAGMVLIEPLQPLADSADQAGGKGLAPIGDKKASNIGAVKLLRLNYSIESGRDSSDAVDIRKAVQANGVDKGKIVLRIKSDSIISVKVDDIISLLGDGVNHEGVESLHASADVGGYADFDSIRAAGIDIRYDAVHDKLVVTSDDS